ncbi:MAG: dockerin type I domain-containing protein [Blautia marasmi]
MKSVVEISELTEEQGQVADVNGDGTADSMDAASILQYASEKITEF